MHKKRPVSPHSLGAFEKMFYHDICHDTIDDSPGRRGKTRAPALSELAVPRYHELDAHGGAAAAGVAGREAPAACPGSGGHADSGEPGVRQAFERTGTQRDLHIEPGT
jgi:hypothetical protein